MNVYSAVQLTEYNGAYAQLSVHKITAYVIQ